MKIASLPEEETEMMASKNMEGEGREGGDIPMDLHYTLHCTQSQQTAA
jgi:hypothetical protein